MPEQGERARQTLAEGGAVEAIAAAISRLSLHAPLPGGDDEDSQPQGRLSVKVRAVATSEARGSSGWIRFMEVISRRPAPHCEVGLLLESGLRKVSYRTTQSATVRSSAQTEAMGAEGGAAPPGTEGRKPHDHSQISAAFHRSLSDALARRGGPPLLGAGGRRRGGFLPCSA
eukprot:COSAG04_NODE_1146_length_8079_cov_7.674687_5_plen_172_part_00